MGRAVAPTVGKDDSFFWEGVQAGELLVRACSGCGRLQHPPRPLCPNCRSTSWDTRRMAGTGSVLSWIESRHPTRPDDRPRTVVLVQLDEGPRLVSNLEIPHDRIRIGMRVEVTFEDVDGVRLPQFRPTEEVGS